MKKSRRGQKKNIGERRGSLDLGREKGSEAWRHVLRADKSALHVLDAADPPSVSTRQFLVGDVSVSLSLLTSYQTCWKGKQIQYLAVGVFNTLYTRGFLSSMRRNTSAAGRHIFSDFLADHYPGDF